MFITALFIILKLWKQHRCPTTEEYYSVIRKNEIMLFAGKWMEMENIMLREVRPKRLKVIFSFICGS
jgi:hypothetical protein